MSITTVAISKKTKRKLDEIQLENSFSSMDETINALINKLESEENKKAQDIVELIESMAGSKGNRSKTKVNPKEIFNLQKATTKKYEDNN